MALVQNGTGIDDAGLMAALPDWFLLAVPLLGLTIVFVLVAGVVGVWSLLAQLRAQEPRLAKLDQLGEIRNAMKRLTEERDELGLRRLEHALLEIRDGQKRLEEHLMRLAESSHGSELELVPHVGSSPNLNDRVLNRLISMGYERVQLLTPASELAEVASEGGDVRVEARRHGALCKGRVAVRDGSIVEVSLKPAYGTFP